MFGIGLAKGIIKDNKEPPKRAEILATIILIVGFFFLFRFLFSIGGVVSSIAFWIFLCIAVIVFISIED